LGVVFAAGERWGVALSPKIVVPLESVNCLRVVRGRGVSRRCILNRRE
jgi:hypothetical protein